MNSNSILILGASGLVGNMLYRVFSEDPTLSVYGTVRSKSSKDYFTLALSRNLICVDSVTSLYDLSKIIEQIRPKLIVNCISVGRPVPIDYLGLIPLLSIFPHRLSYLCKIFNIRLINISSDGVFSGKKGNYTEVDIPDAEDPYGHAKILGEVQSGATTFRTSFIGPEFKYKAGLLEWVLSQSGKCAGYPLALFSGITTLEFGKFLRETVIPRPNMKGIFHIASAPCSKFDLLSMIKMEYKLDINIEPDVSINLNRTLNADMIKGITGYSPPSWGEMLHSLHEYNFGLRNI